MGEGAEANEVIEQSKEMFSNMEMTTYLTEEIELPAIHLQQFQGLQLKGAPMYIYMDMGMMKMTMEVTSISKVVDESVFVKPPEGEYKEMSLEELQQMGMGSGGFGF